MLFNSPTFLWFLVIVYFIFRLLPQGRPRTIFLILASYVFYMSWNPPFVLLLLFSTVLDYNVGLGMARTESPRRRRALLLMSVVGNLGVLGFFKYANFFMANFQVLVRAVGVAFQPQPYNIVLPLGISFYTFQTMSYSLDVYRGAREPTRDWLNFALYVTFFPQLVAGPIVRSGQFLPQVERHQRFQWPAFSMGCNLILMGLIKKMLLADNLAVFINRVWADPAGASMSEAWFAHWGFIMQMYFDFSGYTDIARGLGYLFGYRLPLNFTLPLLATGIRDLWQRWHITLSSWARDYIYLPLGGSRRGAARADLNLFVTWSLIGLWHGASWTFVLFGMMNGVYLVLERRIFGRRRLTDLTGWRRVIAVLVTFELLSLSGIPFRAQGMADVFTMLRHMFVPGAAPATAAPWGVHMWGTFLVAVIGHGLAFSRRWDPTLRGYPPWVVPLLYGAAAAGIMLYGATGNEFVYFQF
ncbi:MAG: MBOAT family protein [Armatimonadota bacterium]|nr:MAG: MBOAT family protein [Armatimonadota bacterium]